MNIIESLKADIEARAEEARNLLASDLFAEAMTIVRTDALMALASVKADDILEIQRLQAIVHCTEKLHDALVAATLKAGERDGGVTA